MEQVAPGIYRESDRLYTENSDPGRDVYGENLVKRNGTEYRQWVKSRSKAAAAFSKGLNLDLNGGDQVLYLGAASGTTVSHFSDILRNGTVFGVEFSRDVIQGLVTLAENRENVAPILADARKPEAYSKYLEQCSYLFQDISQRDQASIFSKNAERYLEPGGTAVLVVKAKSISDSRDVEEIYSEVESEIGLELVESVDLDPFHTDHRAYRFRNSNP